MQKISIDKYRIVPAPMTGIGWVAVQVWDDESGEYRHVASFRSKDKSEEFINNTFEKRCSI